MAGLEVYKNLLLYSLHLVVYGLLSIAQYILWMFNGVAAHLNDIQSGREYEQSAQLLKVWSRYRVKVACIHYRRHFISTHAGFVHPDFALQTHVTLMTVTDGEAIFCVSDKHVNVFDTRQHPFLFEALYSHAQYLLVMPITSFLRLGERQGDPSEKVIWIHHPGRCGSTAISQAFNALPDTVALSEPHCLFALRQTFKSKHLYDSTDWQHSQEYKSIFQSTVRLILKRTHQKADILLLKAAPMTSISDSKLLYELFPNFYQIFMYRDAAPQITSLYRCISGEDPVHDITLWILCNPLLSRLFPSVKPLLYMYNVCDERRHSDKFLVNHDLDSNCTAFIGFVMNWAEHCFHYREINVTRGRTGRPLMAAFKFEHMRADLNLFVHQLFKCCQLEMTSTRKTLFIEALEADSQQGSYVDKKKVTQKKVEVTPEMIKEADIYLRLYDMPAWGEAMDLPGTLTF